MITARLVGDRELILKLQAAPGRIREALRAAITREAIALTRYVKEEKLSGQVLNTRSGTLRRKINYQITDNETQITGSVGVKLAYAAAHEFGFNGTVSVRDYVRHVNSRNIRGSLGDSKRGQVASGIAFVHAHERRMHLPERSYLRSSLRENAATIREQLRSAIMGAL